MKFSLFIVTLLLLSACDIDGSMRANSKDGSAVDARVIAAKSGCMGCHAVSNSVYGPAWKLVSERYLEVPDAKEQLIYHIRTGSAGRWDHVTGGRRMPPQKGVISDAELEIVVDYIMALAAPEPAQAAATVESEPPVETH